MPVGVNIKIVLSLFLLLFLGGDYVFAGNICEINTEHVMVQEDMERFFSANGFDVSKDKSREFKIYFDTPELLLLNAGYSLRFLGTEYHSKKLKQKFHEFIELFSGKNREDRFAVKHYKNVESLEGKHPLIFLVKRKERLNFSEKIRGLGVTYPLRLKEVFQVSSIVHTTSIGYAGSNVGSISKHEMIVRGHQEEIPLTLLNLKLNHELISRLSIDHQQMIFQYANGVRCDANTEYRFLFSRMEDEVRYFQLGFAHPYFINLLSVCFLAFIGICILKILFWSRLKGC